MPIHIEDLEYLHAGGAPLFARFYRPEGQGPFPAVLEVHGGAWTSGDRFNNVSIAEHLSARGIVVLSGAIDRFPHAAGSAVSRYTGRCEFRHLLPESERRKVRHETRA